MSSYTDPVTGTRVHRLVTGPANDEKFYQTHPMWLRGSEYLVFNSDRAGANAPHVLQRATGDIRCVVPEGCGARQSVLSRRDDRLYYTSDEGVYVTSALGAFEGQGNPLHVAPLPPFAKAALGSISLDAEEDALYVGVVLSPEERWALAALDLKSGTWRRVVELDFQIGHVQANPVSPGIVMFCHETGGDSPQRMWVVNADGSNLRPFYKETYEEWVTHEVWWGADRAIFTIWPYDDLHRQKPHGIFSADLATGTPTLHAQYPAWHTDGSPDGQWAVGDDFDRNIWLVKVETGERRLLTQGHQSEGFENHPHPSFTPDIMAVIFNSSRDHAYDIYLVDIPDWESLPKHER